jgi:hypothetical protein
MTSSRLTRGPCTCPCPSGDILKVVKDATQRVYDREKLMNTAFNDIGTLKMGQISNLRVSNQVGLRWCYLLPAACCLPAHWPPRHCLGQHSITL